MKKLQKTLHENSELYVDKTEAFIPNEEVRGAFLRAVKTDGWDDVL